MKNIIIAFMLISMSTVASANSKVDSTIYYQCYAEMTQAHKANGLHDRNRSMSIEVKERVCKERARVS